MTVRIMKWGLVGNSFDGQVCFIIGSWDECVRKIMDTFSIVKEAGLKELCKYL
jgi:hypothetical protein